MQETPSSLAEAEKLLSQHQQIREEIDSYENDYTDMMAYGEKVILVAKLLRNLSVRSLVSLQSDFLAFIKDRQLKIVVKIPGTYLHLIYTLFCLSIFRSCFKIHKPIF